MAKARKQGSAGRTAGIVIAFILVFAILAGVLTYVLGGFNGLIYDRYTLDTSTAALADGAEAKKDEDLTYIELGTGTATYTVNATADAQAELTLRLGAAEADKQLSDLVTVTVNGVGYTIGNAVVKGDKNGAFREVTAGQISVNEGKNVIRIGGKAASVKLEWIRLQVPRGVKITTLESGSEADAGGGMVTTPGQDEDETGVSLVTRKIARENFAEYGIAPTALSAQVITATVSNRTGEQPESLQHVTFTMAWKSPLEEEVTDYVTMSTTETTATISCQQAFSTQIIVTVASAFDETKTATVTLDYVKGFAGYSMKAATRSISNTEVGSTLSGVKDDSGFAKSYPVTEGAVIPVVFANNETKTTGQYGNWFINNFCFPTEVTWGTGSVENTLKSIGVSLKFNQSAYSGFSGNKAEYTINASSSTDKERYGSYFTGSFSAADADVWSQYGLLKALLGEGGNHYAEQYMGKSAYDNTYNREFFNGLDTKEKPIEVTLTLTFAYGSKTLHFYLDVNMAPYTVNSVGVDHNNLYFYE